jgi:hypothetical protein
VKNKNYLTVKNIVQAKGPKNWASVTVLISDKADFNQKFTRRHSEGHFIYIKEQIINRKNRSLHVEM